VPGEPGGGPHHGRPAIPGFRGIEEPDGVFTGLVPPDGRYLSTEVAGGFAGRVAGMFASAGSVDFGRCEHRPPDS
jgi:xylan 1,4-beta-xylosidase